MRLRPLPHPPGHGFLQQLDDVAITSLPGEGHGGEEPGEGERGRMVEDGSYYLQLFRVYGIVEREPAITVWE